MGLEPGKAYLSISALLAGKPWTELMFLSFMFFITKIMGVFFRIFFKDLKLYTVMFLTVCLVHREYK